MPTNTPHQLFCLKVLACSVAVAMISTAMTAAAWANANQDSHQPIVKESHQSVIKLGDIQATFQPQGSLGETTLNATQLRNQPIHDAHDLVRYNSEIAVAQVGRYGNQGFAMRGVDGNRVAMAVDGVALPVVESNEVFARYGYMHEGRLNPDMELMRAVKVSAGADSLMSGSGAVGGSVQFLTKEPSSLIRHGNWGAYAKLGYANKNEEFSKAVGLAGVGEQAEFLLNYTHRTGSETKNHAMQAANDARLSPTYVFDSHAMPNNSTSSLIYPNPMKFTRQSGLAKLYYHLNPNHRLGVYGLYQQQNSQINTESANNTGTRLGDTTRRAFDVEKIGTVGINYRYNPTASHWLDELTADYSRSTMLGLADTWVYNRKFGCSGDDKQACQAELAPDGVSLSHQEYRPTQTITQQAKAELKLLPWELGNVGKHHLRATLGVNRQDYTSSAAYLSHTAAPSRLSYAFVDAKKDNYHFSLIDDIAFNERLRATLGVRYDDYRYQPYFERNAQGFDEEASNHKTCITDNTKSAFCQEYRNKGGLSDVKFTQWTSAAQVAYQLFDDKLTARYKIGTGFLAPTTSQIYSGFAGFGAMQVPNYQLKPETSLNQELQLEYKPTPDIWLNGSAYLSHYRNFIHTRHWQGNTQGCQERVLCSQSINADKAKVAGFKLGVQADLSKSVDIQGKLQVSADYHTASDSLTIARDNQQSLTVNTLATSPSSFMLGVDYTSPNQDWTLHGKARFIASKKAQDAQSLQLQPIRATTTVVCPPATPRSQCSQMGYNNYDKATDTYSRIIPAVTGYTDKVGTYEHINRSKAAVIYDIYGSKRFGKDGQFILNAGVYNLTNTHYIPWESLRMLNTANANTLVDKDGYGFARYSAPGRNYALSLTYEF